MTKKNTNLYGVDWASDGDDEWVGRIERFTIHIWGFGPRYQCVVNVDCLHRKDPVGVGMPISSTKEEAMKAGTDWIAHFKENGVQNAEEYIAEKYTQWGNLYQYRYQVLEQMFFTIGNGYYWLDGGLQCSGPYDHLDYTDKYEGDKFSDNYGIDLEDESISLELRLKLKEIFGEKKKTTPGPHHDDGRVRRLYPVYPGYSNILIVPDDVRDDWLQVAYEAALLLRDKSDVSLERGEDNHNFGVQAVKDLETRFGGRLNGSYKI